MADACLDARRGGAYHVGRAWDDGRAMAAHRGCHPNSMAQAAAARERCGGPRRGGSHAGNPRAGRTTGVQGSRAAHTHRFDHLNLCAHPMRAHGTAHAIAATEVDACMCAAATGAAIWAACARRMGGSPVHALENAI